MHRPLAHCSALLAALAIAATGCGASDEPTREALGDAREPISGGYVDDSDTAVVGIYDEQLGALCSGSLIAPNVVLTARHCVSATTAESIDCSLTKFGSINPASAFFVSTKTELSYTPSDYHSVREVIGLPGDTSSVCGNDQAILILHDPMDPAEAVPFVPRVDDALVKGEQYSAIGFGGTNDTGSGAGVRRRRDTLFVDCVSDECPSYYTRPTEWVGDQGICSGDSGGPAVDMLGRVVGVTSRGAATCDSPVYGYVLGWADWIKATTVYAAGEAGYPPPAWATGWPTDPAYSPAIPVGQACTQPEDCSSNWCIADGKSGYCTRLCNDASPCPDGFHCDLGNTNACLVNPPPKKRSAAATANDGGCAVAASASADPTKPVPWFTGVGVALGLGLLRRRSRVTARRN